MIHADHLGRLRSVFIVGFMLTIAVALTSYIDSSFVKTFMGQGDVGFLFATASALSLLYIAYMPKILANIGVFNSIRISTSTYVLAIIGMISLHNTALLQISFLLYWVSIVSTFLAIDVLIQNYSKIDSIGKTRGLYMTLYNTAFLIAPFIAGIVVDVASFKGVYLLSGFFVVLMTYFFFNTFKDLRLYPKKNGSNFLSNLIILFKNKDLRNVYLVSFTLNFFFAWMTIYMPIYLNQNIGFSWQEIGAIFAIMHIPYVLLEIPWGRIADQILGEKEIMASGILIVGFCTIAIGFISSHAFWVWTSALLLTRIGASMIQVTTESYFFKKIKKDDTNTISVFRNNSPVALLIGPVIASVFLSFTDIKFLFIILGTLVLIALIPNQKLHDTK